jgi:hypothetical protein
MMAAHTTSLWKVTRAYISAMYRDEIAKRLEAILADGTNIDSDPCLAERITREGCPVGHTTLMKVRREHGLPNKFQRMAALRQAAHNMIARQPATEM